ncbi:helix-turn-helix transcriptional regulator [Nesterenkonia xinjiangensis]|uniref:DNA-binding CsgD family transcriptional regulator n=1 Tax=Nesterenkonia xinjiangensis TaxID=225327 RepID=A0A7Z0GNM8_9MICC|nr:LuxR C-terminal-related transcriptional regulator [Nesterenkonia xinjiangensis]NYJ79316.1 DNA-binding CsgD family transcriptional regulator [Nesterenkonia xinjiangensis]
MTGARPQAAPGGADLMMVEADWKRALDHWQSRPAAALLVEGEHGAPSERFIQELARATGTRLHLLGADGRVTAEAVSTVVSTVLCPHLETPAHGPGAVLVPGADRLDTSSLTALDGLLRQERVPVMLTCWPGSDFGYRFARVAGAPRGLRVSLDMLPVAATQRLLTRLLGVPPTQTLTRYLHQVSGGHVLELEDVVEVGLVEGWISAAGRRASIARLPDWLDRRTARGTVRRLREGTTPVGLDVLQQLAELGPRDLSSLAADSTTRDAVFGLEAAGLVVLDRSTVGLSCAAHQHALSCDTERSERSRGEPAPESALGRALRGEPVGEEEGITRASQLLRNGLLSQMRVLLRRMDAHDPRVSCLEAAALAAQGAPAAGLAVLDAGDPPVTGGVATLAHELRSFIRFGLLGDQGDPSGPRSDLSGRLCTFRETRATEYLRRFCAPAPGSWAPVLGDTALSGDLQPLQVETYTLLALDAYAAALAGHRDRARTALQALEQFGEQGIPLVCLSWVAERVSVARVLLDAADSLLPEDWTTRQVPERTLAMALAVGIVEVFRDVVRGVRPESLHGRLEDLWSEFEAGGPGGHVTRMQLEALDFLIDGERSRDLIGPPGVAVTRVGESYGDAWVTAMLGLARLLHAPAEAVGSLVRSQTSDEATVPGVRRLMLRCLALRRARELATTDLVLLLQACRRVDVEEEILDMLSAHIAGDAIQIRASIQRLGTSHPRLHVWEHLDSSGEGPLRWNEVYATLSPRERETVALLMNGLRSADVAERLGISPRTVQTHIRHVYRKLGVGSRTALRALLTRGSPR